MQQQPHLGPLCRPLQTGQTTQYDSQEDDGYYEKGIPKDYTVLTTGDFSGTTNITINGKTHALSNNCVWDNRTGLMWARYVPDADIGPATDGKLFWQQYTITGESVTFDAAGKTITAAAGNPFDTGALCVGRVFVVSGTVNNNGTLTVAGIAGNVITTVEALVNEGPIATDFATTDDLIKNFCDQANSNSLGGYTDWRVANIQELVSLMADIENSSPCLDSTVFPSTPNDHHWTSSTRSGDSTRAERNYFGYPYMDSALKKTSKHYCRLVRGGV